MKKGFTLVELLVVIVIIGILMSAVIGLNWSSISDLRAKALSEGFISSFDEKLIHIQASNYYADQKYDSLDITLNTGAKTISYAYLSWASSLASGSMLGEITDLTLSWVNKSEIILRYNPFQMDCTIDAEPISEEGGENESDAGSSSEGEMESLEFNFTPLNNKKLCFQIDKEYCKLRERSCPREIPF